jgi:N-acetylglucosaminyldiphosphoundecaprenol N-acetyl-beta-D-mannosaminyltransferase
MAVSARPSFLAPRSIRILGVPVHDVTMAETLDLVEQFIHGGGPHQICTVNPEFIMAAQHDADFMRVLNQAALNVPDGVGVLWAARRLGHRLRERVGGSDLVGQIAVRANVTGWKIFLLGAAEGVAEQAAVKLHERQPGVCIVGAFAGSPAIDQEPAIVARIRSAAPDILLVAYGAPKQDTWIARNIDRIGVPVAIGIGGSLDHIVGKQKRAPQWMQRAGLEWFYRLLREPRRWRRQLALPQFVWHVVFEGRPHRGASQGAGGEERGTKG